MKKTEKKNELKEEKTNLTKLVKDEKKSQIK